MFAERMMMLFNGLDRAHGEYKLVGNALPGQKFKGKAITKKAPVTEAKWQKHLEGEAGIGIIPIREDNCVYFGAIDIDSYENFDIVELEKIIYERQWPILVLRSKSGGAHLYIFCEKPIPAPKIRVKLKQIAIALGHHTAEIFPKQDKMLSKDDVGNWINMPYFGGDDSERFCVYNSERLNLEQFIELAEANKVLEEDLEAIQIIDNEYSDAPPCLEMLCAQGFPHGSMNNALFNMGVYARMKYEDDWQSKVIEYNQKFMGPGSSQEVQQIIKSLDKKKYIYRCSEPPLCGICNKSICATRKYGVASEKIPYKSAGVKKANRPCILDDVERPVQCFEPPSHSDDEPYWVFKIHGQYMDVTVDMIQSQLKFVRAYLKKFKKMLLSIDEDRWASAMNLLLEGADMHDLASDAGPEGQLWIHLENFCTGRVQARTQEELILGKPWSDGGRIYFRSTEFSRYLDSNRFKQFSERDIYAILRRSGAQHHKFMIKNKCVSCWSIPAFDDARQDFDSPQPLPEEF